MTAFLCWLLGHAYYVRMEFAGGQRCVGCHRCRRFWAMHDGARAFLAWDGDFSELYGYQPSVSGPVEEGYGRG